jgi:multidrug efflux pump subunit AcrB
VRSGFEGEIVRLRDLISEQRMDSSGAQLGGIELGAKNQDTLCYLDGKPSVGLSIYQQPGSNALATADKIRERMEQLKLSFPDGVDYGIVYDTTPFIDESIHEVFKACATRSCWLESSCFCFCSPGEPL